MSQFDDLLTDLQDVLASEEALLVKAQTPDDDDAADDTKIKDAASGDTDDDGEPDADDVADDYDDEDEDDGDDGDGDDDGDEVMSKSFKTILDDGTEVEAINGDTLIKSFNNRLEAMQAQNRQDMARVVTALSRSTRLVKSLREQNVTLARKLDAIGNTGRGRKSTLSVHERPSVGSDMAQPEGLSPQALMAKALSAQRAGRITGGQVAEMDAYLARGITIPSSLLDRLAD